MSRPTIRKPDIYVGGRKVAYAESGELTITDNGEQQIGTEGVIGDSDGAITSELTLMEVTPTAGIDSGLLDTLLDQQDVTVQWFQSGQTLTFDGRCGQAKLNGESRSGSAKANWTVRGGKPDRA